MTKLYAALVLCLFASCVSPDRPPTEATRRVANYGSGLSSEHQEVIKQAFGVALRDPWSAHYEFSEPEEGWMPEHYFTGPWWKARGWIGCRERAHRFGWLVNFRVNAKNGHNGYTGWEPHTALIRDNEVHGIFEPSRLKPGFLAWLVGYPKDWYRVR